MKRKNTTSMRRRTVRVVAAVISVLMLLSSVTVLPVFSADTLSDYTVDFVKLYKDKGLTENLDVKANEDIANVNLIANGSVSSAILSQNGLNVGYGYKSNAGVTIQTPETGDFVIEVEASLQDFDTTEDAYDSTNNRYPYTMEFSYDYSESTKGWSNNSYLGLTWNSTGATGYNKFEKKVSNDEGALFESMFADGETCHYAFYIQNGVFTRMTVSCGDVFATASVKSGNAAENGFSAASGLFAFRSRSFGEYAGEHSINITKISVTSTEASTLDANRTVPSNPATNYTDKEGVNYTVGTVLHNMDFSKIDNFSDTGYFITKDNNNEIFANVVGDNLLFTTNNYWSYLALTANNIPKNIQDYTVSFRFHFLTASSVGRIQLVHGSGVKDTGKYQNLTYIQEFYQNGTFDSNTITNATAIANGDWVTVTSSYANGMLDQVIFTYDDGTSQSFDCSAKNFPKGSEFIVRFAKTQAVEFSDVQIVAGSYAQQKASNKGLLFPEADNALVQTVKSPVVAKYVQQRTNESGLVDARFVSTVNFANLDAFAKIGYEITSIKINGTEYATDAITISDTQVFKTINAADKTYQAGEGCYYIFALELINFETEGTYEVTLTAFAEKENGARIYDYNGAVSITVTEGVVAVA